MRAGNGWADSRWSCRGCRMIHLETLKRASFKPTDALIAWFCIPTVLGHSERQAQIYLSPFKMHYFPRLL